MGLRPSSGTSPFLFIFERHIFRLPTWREKQGKDTPCLCKNPCTSGRATRISWTRVRHPHFLPDTTVQLLVQLWTTRESPFRKGHEPMSPDKLMHIRAFIPMYSSYHPDVAVNDPLWHIRLLLEHFVRNTATLAVPVGTNTIDENSVRSKLHKCLFVYKFGARKFGIHFFEKVEWSHAYLHTLQENGLENLSGAS